MPKLTAIFAKFIVPIACLATATSAFAGTSTPEPGVPEISIVAGVGMIAVFFGFAFWRQRRQERLHDLLYMTAAMAWVSACDAGTSHAA